MSLAVAAAFTLWLSGVKPPDYTERSLCDLLAGAQCQASKCLKDSKERCEAASRRCKGTSKATVPPDKAERTAACAKALLAGTCGGAAPAECSGVL